MPENSSEKSKSSQGRGGNTEQEPHFQKKIDLTLMVRETSQHRMGFPTSDEQKDLEVTAESSAIGQVLEGAFRSYS